MEHTIILMLAGILIAGALLYIIISFAKRPSKLDVEKYRGQWLKIEKAFNKDDANTYSIAVLNADSLLDKALKDKGIAGTTMGERMKQASWSNADSVWAAHKLRNKIAHEHDTKVEYRHARMALNSFKQALKDLGAI
ncbi:MAG TPA: hypothetical protein PLY16_03325 [Candidatus Saccharibacteria bacterium]|nr:hypothetical protein [Candidatus Saccharibacteria bacterium]